jgi:hypothetical protein
VPRETNEVVVEAARLLSVGDRDRLEGLYADEALTWPQGDWAAHGSSVEASLVLAGVLAT